MAVGIGGRTGGALVGLLVGVVVVGLIGYAFTVSALGVWRGTVAAATSAGVPGQVTDVTCGSRNVCSATFTSDDASVRLVGVRLSSRPREVPAHGSLVRAIDMGPVDGPNSVDTVYTDGIRFSVAGYVLLALLLTFCALVTAGVPLLFVVGAVGDALLKRRRGPDRGTMGT